MTTPSTNAANLLAKRAAQYAADLARTDGTFTTAVQFSLLQLCNAMLDVVPDGELIVERDNIAQSNGWDVDGLPVRSEAA